MHDKNTEDDIVREDDENLERDDLALEDDEMPIAAKLKSIREVLKAVQKERDDNLAGWQRAKADLVNVRRQASIETAENAKFAAKNVLLDLLPVLDSFDMAIGSPSWETIDPTWRKGMEGVYQQALNAAKGHGLEQSAPKIGDEFDPNKHEAVGTEQTDRNANDHRIAKVLQKGYELHGTTIRPAKVIIYSHEY